MLTKKMKKMHFCELPDIFVEEKIEERTVRESKHGKTFINYLMHVWSVWETIVSHTERLHATAHNESKPR